MGFGLQVLFHHMFVEIINDVGHHVVANNEYSLEFSSDGVFLLVFIRFWLVDKLCRVFLKRTGRTHGQSQAEITLISYVMGEISTGPQIVSVTGCTCDTLQLLDDSPYCRYSVQSPPRFEELQIRTLMHKKSSSVFGNIDFFGLLQYLVVSLGSSLEMEWVMLSPELSKVIPMILHCLIPYMDTCKSLFTFQAIRTCQLDICSLPTLCQELLKHWTKVTEFLLQRSVPQGMQGVRKQVGSILIVNFVGV